VSGGSKKEAKKKGYRSPGTVAVFATDQLIYSKLLTRSENYLPNYSESAIGLRRANVVD